MSRWSLRLEQAEVSRLAWAFAISLAFHVLVYSSYHTANKYHLLQYLHLPAWVHAPKFLTELIKPKLTPPPPRRQDTPLVFVNVSPAQATPEPPKEAKYYSDKNSLAANPSADKITDQPKIDGKHPELVKTEDVPRSKFTPLQPSAPPEAQKEPQPPPQPPKETPRPRLASPKEALAEAKPKPAEPKGDLTLAKPSPTPTQTRGDANEAKPTPAPTEADASEPKPAPRPRTVRQALAQLQQNQLPGEKMLQDGGVARRHEMASLDTKATPFGAYDARLVEAIAQRWYALLDEQNYASDSRGKVVLQFRLHYDGRVTEMNMAENTAGFKLGLLCEKAVQDPAPFEAWPSDMRRTLGDIRNIQFTFYYY